MSKERRTTSRKLNGKEVEQLEKLLTDLVNSGGAQVHVDALVEWATRVKQYGAELGYQRGYKKANANKAKQGAAW